MIDKWNDGAMSKFNACKLAYITERYELEMYVTEMQLVMKSLAIDLA